MKYDLLPGPASDLSRTTLREAAAILGPAFIYTLAVSDYDLMTAKDLLKQLGMDTIDNPLSPHVNLIATVGLGRGEWALGANGRFIGSPGVT